MKKGAFVISLSVLLIIAAFIYFRLVVSVSGIRSVYDAVPSSSVLLLEWQNFKQSSLKIDQAQYKLDIKQSGLFQKIEQQTAQIEKLLYINEFKAIESEKLIASLHIVQNNNYDFLYLIQTQQLNRNEFKAMILAIKNNYLVKQYHFKEENIYSLSDKNDSLQTQYLAKVNGMLLFSKHQQLVEAAITQLGTENSLLNNPNFIKIKDLAGSSSDVLLLMNFKNMASLAPLFSDSNTSTLIHNISLFSDWTESDIMFEKNAILLNGYTHFESEKKSWIAQFTGTKNDLSSMPDAISNETALMLLIAQSDVHAYFDQIKLNIQDHENLKFLPYFKTWTDTEWAFGLIEPESNNWQKQNYLIVKAQNVETAQQQLVQLEKFLETDSISHNLDTFIPKGRLRINHLLNEIYGKYLLPMENPYYEIYGQYVFFANDSQTLKHIISSVKNEQTFSKNIEFVNFSNTISTNANLYFYINTQKLSVLLSSLFSNLFLEKNTTPAYKKFSPAAIRFNHEGSLFFTSAQILYKNETPSENEILWEYELDTLSATLPALVTNHNSKDKEVIIQDLNHTLYLLDKKGKIIWKNPLQEKIISTIYQIDFYQNGKLQYLFNTENFIFLIDREGNKIEDFPKPLPEKAQNGMLLTYYDDIKQHRIFIVCNNKVQLFDLKGNKIKGWNNERKLETISHPLQHFKVNQTDYILAQSQNGTIYFFDRKGEFKFPPLKLNTKLINELQKINSKEFEFHVADTSGNVYTINSEGKYQVQKFESTSSSYLGYYFDDIKADGQYESIFLSTNKILAASNMHEPVLDITLDKIPEIKIYKIKDQNKFLLGFNYENQTSAQLVNADGTMFNSFRLKGNSLFEISSFEATKNNNILLTTQGNRVFAYQLP